MKLLGLTEYFLLEPLLQEMVKTVPGRKWRDHESLMSAIVKYHAFQGFVVADTNDQPHAFMWCVLSKSLVTDETLCITMLTYVKESHKGKNLAPEMVKMAIEQAKIRKADEFIVGIHGEFLEHLGALKAFGFEEFEQHWRHPLWQS